MPNPRAVTTPKAPPVRLIVSILLILLQLALLAVLIERLRSYAWEAYALLLVVSVLAVGAIISNRENPSYKIIWIVVVLVFPPFGAVFYLLFGGGRVVPRRKRLMTAIAREGGRWIPQDEALVSALEKCNPALARQANYLYRAAGAPIFDGSKTDFYAPGERVLPPLLADLERAERYIFMEFFILASGQMWDAVHAVLRRKAASGLDVRVMFDDLGCTGLQEKGFTRALRSEGIRAAVFNPMHPSVDLFMNNRSHRKIVSVDGRTAFTGGFNIADEYINVTHPHGHWMDCGIRVEGAAAWSLTVMFLNMWRFTTREAADYAPYCPRYHMPGPGYVIPYCDGPLTANHPARGIYMEMIFAARKYLYITSPYLILDNEISSALGQCALSGVDVRIVTPRVRDKWYVHPVTQSYYRELLESGVRIYEYTPGFIHSKLFVADDEVATCGSVNLDYRSLYFHFECGAWLCQTPTVLDIRRNIEDVMAVSGEITLPAWKKRPLGRKILQAVLHLLAPFM